MRALVALAASAALLLTVACTPGPLSGPVSTAPMSNPRAISQDPSTSGVEAVRRQLAGTWDLVSLETSSGANGARAQVTATGTLVYDEFGNLTIDARTTDPDAPVAAREVPIVSFKGRAVIDTTQRELRLMALTGNVDPNEVLSPEQRRKYEFTTIDGLKLTSVDANGAVTAVSVWKRRPPR
jgi:hypothetical protein